MGEITDMLLIRMEELQIGWACSAQNPSLLPESLKRARGSNLAAKANQHFTQDKK